MPDPELSAIVAELSARYPLFATTTIERWVTREAARYADAPITAFVPILVRRGVERTMHDLDRIETTSHPAAV